MNVNLVVKLLGLCETNSEARYQLIMAGMFGPVSPVTSCISCQNYVINPRSVVFKVGTSQWSLRLPWGLQQRGKLLFIFTIITFISNKMKECR